MLIKPTWSVHTAFMRFAIDVLFLDREMTVVGVKRRLRPASRRSTRGSFGPRARGGRKRAPLDRGRRPARLGSARGGGGRRSRLGTRPSARVLFAAPWPRLLVRYGAGLDGLIAAFTCAVLVVLSVIDVESRRLPNNIVLPSAALVLAARLVTAPEHWATWIGAGVGAFACFFLLALVYPAAMGMGDVKLALLLGFALGSAVLPGLMIGTLAAALAGVVLLARGSRRPQADDPVSAVPRLRGDRRAPPPHAVAGPAARAAPDASSPAAVRSSSPSPAGGRRGRRDLGNLISTNGGRGGTRALGARARRPRPRPRGAGRRDRLESTGAGRRRPTARAVVDPLVQRTRSRRETLGRGAVGHLEEQHVAQAVTARHERVAAEASPTPDASRSLPRRHGSIERK